MIHAGQLRDRVAFKRPTQTRDPRGEAVTAWQEIKSVPARVRPMTLRELERASQTTTEATWKIVIRFTEGITTDQRIRVHDGPTLNIASIIDHDHRHHQTTILAKEHDTPPQ